MLAEQRCNLIIRELLMVFESGLLVSEDMLFFAESMYGLQEKDLEAALVDPDFEGGETLLNLIFFPDKTLRLAVERHMSSAALEQTDEQGIMASLLTRLKRVSLRVAGGENSFFIPVDEGLIEDMVKRLYLCRSLDADLCHLLSVRFSGETNLSARILMRCQAGVVFGEAKRFLNDFIDRATVPDEEFLELFKLLLTLLSGPPVEGKLPKHYILEHKTVLEKQLLDLRVFEQKRDRYGLEYLLMQRYPVPCESAEILLEKLRLANLVIRTVPDYQ